MKFEKLAVIGNPPYNANSNGKDAVSLYDKFVESAIDLNPDYVSMIVPSRWMVSGKGLKSHRERMMNDRHIQKIVHFSGEREIFPTVSIKGGVNFFLWNKYHDGKCEFESANTTSLRYLNEHDVIIQDNNAYMITEKVKNSSSTFISSKCLARKPFGIISNFSEWVESGVKCYAIKRTEHHVKPNTFTDKNNVLDKWKVCTSKGTSEGNINPDKSGAMAIATNMFLIEPNAICTETYLVVNAFNSKSEAENFLSYMKTKFFRFMMSISTITQNLSMSCFAFVPDVEDYSAPWTDKELYNKYNLTRQQVAYIESKIKAI